MTDFYKHQEEANTFMSQNSFGSLFAPTGTGKGTARGGSTGGDGECGGGLVHARGGVKAPAVGPITISFCLAFW